MLLMILLTKWWVKYRNLVYKLILMIEKVIKLFPDYCAMVSKAKYK